MMKSKKKVSVPLLIFQNQYSSQNVVDPDLDRVRVGTVSWIMDEPGRHLAVETLVFVAR